MCHQVSLLDVGAGVDIFEMYHRQGRLIYQHSHPAVIYHRLRSLFIYASCRQSQIGLFANIRPFSSFLLSKELSGRVNLTQ